MEAEDGASSALPVSVALLVPPLVDLLCSGSLDKHLSQRMKTDFLSRLIGLSPRLLLAPPTGRLDCWKRLLADLLRCNKTEQASDSFHKNWLKLVNIATSSTVPLANLLYLSNELSRSIKDGGVEREVCSKLWTSLANKLTLFITETSQVSNGSSLSPSFETVRSVLKFPFLHLLDNGERSDVISVMDVWKGLYETTSLHMGLVVKETNLCTELVCTDLYSAYGQYTKQVPSSLDQRHQVLRFDLYQNAMASAISYIVSKIKWGALAQSTTAASAKERGGRVKSMETLLSLLAWQLAAFWDTAKKGPLHLPQLTTPYTLLEVVESIYHHIPSSPLVTMATEMIGQPLATLFEAVMESCHAHQPSSRPRLSPQDLQHRVEKVWKSITMCFQSRHAHPYDSALLSTLSPLLVATLNSSDRQLSSLSLSFWAVTFDRSQTLDYPARLRDYFVKYLKESKQSSELKLPGLHGNSNVHKEMGNTQADQSEVIQFSDTQSHSQIWNQDLDITTDSVALPHSSPRKGSFLNRHPPTSPYKPRPAPSSPLAKQLDEVLARSATTVEKVQSSPLKVVGVTDKAESPLASARRRLDLNGKSEEYKSVAPPSRKRRLLTEHQEEVMKRRRSDLPTLYNALDPALDSAPVIMDECTQSEGDPPVIKQAQPPMPSHSGVSTSESGSIPSLHSNTNHVTVSPTSRDTPITIPDSPPPTSPPSLIQHPVPMVTSTTNVSTHPSPATALHTATVPHPRGVVSPPISTPQPHPSAPPPVPHSHTVLSTSIPSHVAMTTGSFPVSVSAPPPHLSSSSVGRAVVISHPGSGSVLQIIPSHPPVAMATHDVLLPRIIQGAPPLRVHTPAMMGPEMVAQPVQQVLLPQGIQPGMPPAVLTHNINNNDIIMTSLESHRLPTYHEAVSHKVLEEAFARILGDPNASPPRRMGRAKRAPPQRKEMDAGKDREISQKQLPSEGDEGDAPGDQGEVDARLKKSENVLSSSSEVACAVEAIEDRPLTSGASSGATATPTINATPTSAIVSLTESEGHSRAVQSCDTDTRDSDQLVRLSVGGAEIEQKECPNITLEVAGVSTEPLGGVVMEDIEDPLGGVKKTKKTAEKEEGGGEKMEQAASEKVGGATLSSEAEVKVQSPISPELLSSELEEKVEGEMDVERSTELNKNEKMETANVMSDGQAKPSESNSDPAVPARTESLESEATQKSNSKVTESTEPGISDGIVKANSSGVRPPSESGEGRKRLSLRRHTTPSASAGGVESDAGFTAGEGEGAESRKSSLVDTPTNGKNGILKHTSQFDTPSTAKAGRRVQFATEPVFHEHQSKQQQTEESGQKSVTPKHSRGPRTPQGSFSSRRTLLMSHTPPKMILVNKPLPPATPTGPVYPSLKDCQSPVEQILPALSPSSKFTHGLLKLVSAQNITTVGNISSLSEQEVQTLPIKSPKVPTLRGALRVFEQQLQGSKRKSSIDGEVGLATPPPKKQPRLDSDLSSTATSSNKDSTSAIAEGSSKSAIVEDGSKSAIVEDGSKSAIDEDSSKSAIVEDGSKSAIDEDSSKSEGSTESAIAEGSTESAIVEQGRETVLPRPEGDADQSNEEDLMPDGEELSEGSHDIDGPIITLCTPESQLTPPIEAAVVSEGGAGEGGAMDDKMESVAEEEMEVEEQKRSVEDALLPETPPISPPHPSSTSQAGNTASSIGHDHTYCSQPAPDTTKSTPADVETDNKEGHVTESSDHVTESNRTTLSMMTHDHTYCSSQPRGDEVKEGRCHGRADGKGEDASNRSKLSLTVHDHTYCSNSWQQTGEPRLTAARFTPQQLPMEEGEGRALESAAGGGHVTKEASRSDTAEMETETADVGDSSDIIETDSSLSQELFSQQASQVHARGNEAPPTTEPSNDLLTSGDSRDNRNCSVASAVARGNDERSGVVEKVISADSAEKDGEREAGDRDRVSERERGWEQNIAVNSHQAKDQTPPTVSTGSEVSSDSLNPTHIAECSQRPSSANPLPSSSSSISDHTHSGDSGDLVDLLTRFTELGDKVSKLMEGKPSLSREEVLACQKAYRLVATFSQTVVDTLVQQTSNQNAAS